MSEFIAEAQVLIQPNTAAFAASLKAQLEAAVAKSGPVTIPVVAAPVGGAGGLVAAQQAATAATLGLSSATGLETQALDLNAKAQLDAAAAAQISGAAAEQEATQIALVTAAENAAAVAFRKSEAVALAAVGTTSELAAARSTLKAATSATVANEVALDAALATTSLGHKNAAAGALVEARTLEANAKAAFDAALAHKGLARSEAESAAAARASAAAHAQAGRGLAAETLALGGLRGATLAASAPFLAGATAAIIFAKSIKEVSDETEQFNKVAVVFGDSAREVEDFAKTSATAFGISSTEALKATGIFGNLFRTIHIATPVAADMSIQLVKLSSDLASFNNASPERTLQALQSGLVGQSRPLRQFGIFLSAARVQIEALRESGKKFASQLTDAEKVQARFNLILSDSALAQGDFARTSDRTANQSRILAANISNLEVKIGDVLLPVVERAVHDLNAFFIVAGKTGGALKAFGQQFETPSKQVNDFAIHLAGLTARVVLLSGFEIAGRFVDHFTHSVKESDKAVSGFHFTLGGLAADLALIRAQNAAGAIKDITGEVNALAIAQLKIETGLAPGGRGAEEANLKKQIAAQKKLVAQSTSGTNSRKEALQTLKQQQDALAALEAKDAQDAKDRTQKIKDAADARKKAAEDAAKAQTDATNAFIESFSGRRQRLSNQLQRAGLTDTLKDEIATNKAIIAFDLKEIKAIKERIQHLHLHGAALKAARDAIKAINQEIIDTRVQIQKDQQAQQAAAKDALTQRLDLRIQLAEARGNTKAEIRARRAKLAEITAELARLKNAHKKNTIAWLELKVAQAEEIKAIKELEKTDKEKQSSQKSLFFQFLQTQQGFAANLLGNLIPGFATGGLVGGSGGAAAAAGDTGLRQVAGGFEQPRGSVQGAAAVASSRDRGVRPVQVDTTNQLLRQILRSLQNLNGRTQHPEARHNRAVGSAVLDTMGGVHGA